MLDVERLRGEFPALARRVNEQPVIFADNAATSLKPQCVIDAVTHYYTQVSINVHRGVNLLAEEADALYEEARRRVARLINARPEEIVFVRNTTEAINLAAHIAGLGTDDEVVSSLSEHHSNFLPWAARGSLRAVAPGKDGVVTPRAMAAQISSRTRLVAIGHVSNVTGVVQPVADILHAARKQGALTLVDAAQSVPHLPVDVRALDCDFLAFSGHKMLGPSGIGVLYGRRALLEASKPLLYGGGMVKRVSAESFETAPLPHKFEAGTPNIEGAIGMGAAAERLTQLGMSNVYAHSRELARTLTAALRKIKPLTLAPAKPPEERLAIASFTLKGFAADNIAMLLSHRYGIMIRSGLHCAEPLVQHLGGNNLSRISLYLYNTPEEVEFIARSLRSLCGVFGS